MNFYLFPIVARRPTINFVRKSKGFRKHSRISMDLIFLLIFTILYYLYLIAYFKKSLQILRDCEISIYF